MSSLGNGRDGDGGDEGHVAVNLGVAFGEGADCGQIERHTPTIARAVPAKNDLALGQLLGYEPSESLTYIRLNIQTPCPPRGAVPVHPVRYAGLRVTVANQIATL